MKWSFVLMSGVFLAGLGCPSQPQGSAAGDEKLKQKLADLEQENADLKAQLGGGEGSPAAAPALPASLGQYYPKGAKELPYLGSMFGMAAPMMTIGVALQNQDAEGAKAAFEQFKTNYAAASEMVPEWKGMFPAAPVDALGAALASGDPGQVMPAMQEAGKVCATCHHTFMPMVQQLYRWGDPSAIQVPDPMGGDQPVGWPQLMMGIEGTMSAIGYHAQAGRTEAAVGSVDALAGMMGTLAETCKTCHTTERKYYVDAETLGLLDAVKSELGAAKPDPAKIGASIEAFAHESCAKCHLVHIPAAFARYGHE